MTRDATESERERVLDRCIDALLAGRPWRDELSTTRAGTEEFELLMRVAEDFLAASPQLPPPAPRRRFSIWRRLAEAAAEPFRFRTRAHAFDIRARGRAVLAAVAAILA